MKKHDHIIAMLVPQNVSLKRYTIMLYDGYKDFRANINDFEPRFKVNLGFVGFVYSYILI